MTEDRTRISKMVAVAKISVQEARKYRNEVRDGLTSALLPSETPAMEGNRWNDPVV